MRFCKYPVPSTPSHGRRQVLKFGGLGAGALAMPLAGTAAGLAAQGKQAPHAYAGPGYYLYPAWGEPALYYVSEVPAAQGGSTLAFRDPVAGTLLWTQSLAVEADFAGRLQA